MTAPFKHDYPFDPSYGYDRTALTRVEAPPPPGDFEAFWRRRYQKALAIDPRPSIHRAQGGSADLAVMDLKYRSTQEATIRGWLVLPRSGPVRRALVIGHGYGGRQGPDLVQPVAEAALLFPCFRGLSRSAKPPISQDPQWHVLHDIDKRDDYILGRCVEDLWLAVSVLLALFPWLEGHVGYSGVSFGGGIGSLALPWDQRIARAHLLVPTFGNHPLRLKLPSVGSAAAVRRYAEAHPEVLATLAYYDAASAARFVSQPVHVGAALFDPAVAPPGQFAIYNALPGCKQIFTLDAGHFDYPHRADQDQALHADLRTFFDGL